MVLSFPASAVQENALEIGLDAKGPSTTPNTLFIGLTVQIPASGVREK